MDKKQLQAKLAALGENHEYMSAEQIALFREHLLAQHDEALASHDAAKQEYSNIDHDVTDPLDVAENHAQQESLLRKIDTLRERKTKIQNALKLITAGEYGFCETCGEEIGLARLVSVPFSTRDAECENLHAMNEKRLSGKAVGY